MNRERKPVEERTFTDVCDGTEWEKHEYLGASDYQGETRLAFQGYCDDVDIPNPIGAASGHHKMTFVFTSCINRDPLVRTQLGHINLATVVLSADVKEFTPAVVISGRVNEATNSSSLGASLRRLQAGVPLEVPGRAEPVMMRGWLFSFVGDAPAVAEMIGTKISLSEAKNPCSCCENSNRPLIYAPSRWIGCKCEDDRNHDDGCCCVFALRTKVRYRHGIVPRTRTHTNTRTCTCTCTHHMHTSTRARAHTHAQQNTFILPHTFRSEMKSSRPQISAMKRNNNAESTLGSIHS